MLQLIKKVKKIIKATFISSVLAFVLISGILSNNRNKEQMYDLKTASVISIGFSSSICLLINNRNKV